MCMVLRPHHGMCFQFYEGKGYSAEFTDHMGRVTFWLILKAFTPLTLRSGRSGTGWGQGGGR